jgi:CheY-like chemotaxis protein
LIRQIRKLPKRPPIIAMSSGGRGSAGDYLQLATALGASETIEKPFTLAQMTEAVQRVISSGAEPERK